MFVNVTSLILTGCIVHNSMHSDKEYVGTLRLNGKCNIIVTYRLHCSYSIHGDKE